ncbi:PilN domain-containing protein [Azoarcus sp. PA01]|nr:PilN domain-containing protein [Azoarcus sp. PA01]
MALIRGAPAPLALDFAPIRRRPGWLGWVLLSVGLVAVGIELLAFEAARVDLAEREAIVARLRHQLQRKLSAAPAAPSAPLSAKEAQAAIKVAAQTNADWSGLFTGLARARSDDVALLEIHANAPGGTLTLVGEAPALGAAFDHLRRLQQQDGLRDTRIGRHEWTSGDGGDVVRFATSARWGNAQ